MSFLARDALDDLPECVQRPLYDRDHLTPGIVHIGVGNFHRAHQSWYLHRLMQQGYAHDWAIIGAGVRPYDNDMRAKLMKQNCLTSLIELDPNETTAEVVGSMIGYVAVEKGNRPLIEQMAARQIRIVSLTVTEGGYYLDPVSRAFDSAHPDIQHDAANPCAPLTAFGAIVAALKLRRDRDTGPFTVQSCDNLQGNGNILRQTVVSLARLNDPGLAVWIDTNCSFPNSMVDCIVPATGPDELAMAREFGLSDDAPVTHENFRQWVIEDDFCAGRPDWNKVGATFVDDVHGFEAQKIRILNAGHQIIAGAAEIMGIETVAQAMSHETISAFFDKVEREEILPGVKAVPGMTPQDYLALTARRFANPAIGDTIRRIACDGSSRHPGFVLPTVNEAITAGTPLDGLALVEATWARMCFGAREDGSRIAPNDPIWDQLTTRAIEARTTPQRWLEMRNIYGDLAHVPRFADAFESWLGKIYKDGVASALQHYLKGV
ncbi:mannitol dehydrogenase family protein [Phaeobacter sp. C3_T13_0]|uniref:mannitol dehydrogenase family protein n=1 Tax=Phaeobacter cretensis TaxID=3342641 RepID=UPI0039BD4BA2